MNLERSLTEETKLVDRLHDVESEQPVASAPDLRPSKETVRAARELRKRGTPAEVLLWQLLRNRQLGGFKFRRQHPIGTFVADFFCDDARLVIEIDGAVHREPSQQERDRVRDQVLEQYGYACLRLTNEDVIYHTQEVLTMILQAALSRSRSRS